MTKLKKDSIHVSSWCFFYSKIKAQLPDDLCSYFRQLVIAYILIIPYTAFIIPYLIFNSRSGGRESSLKKISISFVYYVTICLILSLVIWFIYIHYNLIKAMLGCYSYNYIDANITISLYAILLLSMFFKTMKIFRRNIRPKEWMVTQYIKAKKKKYCPKIEWE